MWNSPKQQCRRNRTLIVGVGLGISLLTLSWQAVELRADGCGTIWQETARTNPRIDWECQNGIITPKPVSGSRTLTLQNPCEGETKTKTCALYYTLSSSRVINEDQDDETMEYTFSLTDSCDGAGSPLVVSPPEMCCAPS